jgi:hypothetical protein
MAERLIRCQWQNGQLFSNLFSNAAAKAPAPVDWDMDNTTLVLNISERVSLNNPSAQNLKIGSANNPGSLYFGSGKLQQPYSSAFRMG